MLLAARSDVALHRLLDVLPAFEGDARVTRLFTLVPGSRFGTDALAAVDAAGGRTVPWDEARGRAFDLIVTASPKGALRLLRGARVLLPHGAGFGKALASEGSADSASGLDPAYLRPDDGQLALHALAHPDQVARLAAVSPEAAARARVVGDPTLDRMLASRSLRERYRGSLGTGARQLVAVASTWGPESLLRQRPHLTAELAASLPVDSHQLALIVHPNERSTLGSLELRERLAPALAAGMVLAAGYEEWAAVLVAADALVTDHGSAALYYAAALGDGCDRPLVNAYDGGSELIPGSPIAELLSAVPRLDRSLDLREALAGYRSGPGRTAARAAFAEQGRALPRLRRELYALLGLDEPAAAVRPRVLPPPAGPATVPAAFDVHVDVTAGGREVRVERTAAGLGPAGHHLAVEHGAAGAEFTRTAGLLYRRPAARPAGPYRRTWTAAGWTASVLADHPGCGTAAVVLPDERCLLRRRGDDRLWAVSIEPWCRDGRVVHGDPAAVLSALHAALAGPHRPPDRLALTCRVGEHAFAVRMFPADPDDGARPL